ncbi:MAG: hypothetical protein HUU15_09245 [Candidatus Brocadiae bacterium]|nr:hypothetical protein [Candidatus Brocadiia bacterium]
MKRFSAVILAAALAGCVTPVSPGVRSEYLTKVSWKGAAVRVDAADPGPVLSSTPGAREYVLNPAEWNPWFAKSLADDLRELGAAAAEEPVVTVALEESELEARAAGQEFWADLTVSVRGAGIDLLVHGRDWSGDGYTEAVRRAAADALRQIVENEDLRRAATK